MEKIKALINKLREQADQNAATPVLLAIVNELQLELASKRNGHERPLGSTKVAVVMPAHSRYMPSYSNEPAAVALQEQVKEIKPVPVTSFQPMAKLVGEEQRPPYNVIQEIPALNQQEIAREINDIMGHSQHSINDVLKTPKTELADALTDSPIRDLKKGIGINDRYVFVSELFRGDDAMYERSIKTINGFVILAEAEYWIERELKVKLGWDDDKSTTRHFYQLVKRRFS
jgi:hypothetical protein